MSLHTSILRAIALAIVGMALTVAGHRVLAAGECKIEYGFHTGSGINVSHHVETELLNVNETKTINRGELNYVRNLNDNKTLFTLQGTTNVTLGKNGVNPPRGFYRMPVTLKTVKCLNQTSAGFTSPEALINASKQANNTVGQIASGLKDTFGLNAQQVTQYLKNAGFSPQDIASATDEVFNLSEQRIAQLLKATGYSGNKVATALRNGLDTTAHNAAAYLKNLFGSSPSQMAQWLRSAGYPLDDVARALLSVETDPQKILQALKSSFNLNADQLVSTLKRIDAIITPQNCNTEGCNRTARWLKNIGYALNDILKALKTHFNISVQAAYDIAQNVYRESNAVIQQALAFAGYTADQIGFVISK